MPRKRLLTEGWRDERLLADVTVRDATFASPRRPRMPAVGTAHVRWLGAGAA